MDNSVPKCAHCGKCGARTDEARRQDRRTDTGAQEAPRGTARHARETLASVRARIDYIAESLAPDLSPATIGAQRRVLWNVSRDMLAVIKDIDDLGARLETVDRLCTCAALVAEHAAVVANDHKDFDSTRLALQARKLAQSLHRLHGHIAWAMPPEYEEGAAHEQA